MQPAHRLLVPLVLTLLAAGCAVPTEDADRLFDQGGDVVADEPGDGPGEASEPLERANATLHVVDVGQGDGLVLHLPDHVAVYDTGRWHGDSQTAVREHLEAEGADPDALVISHPDADHAGGCDEVLEAFDVATIYHPGIGKDTQTWQDCRQAIEAASARDANAGSIALEVTYGDASLALTGDVPCDVEDRILEHRLVDDVDLVQIGHHGSSTSTCQRWLDATEPEAGFVSVGEDNRYGHPHREVLDRLAQHGVDVYRTDHHGALEATTDGTSWDVRTTTGEPTANPDASEANATVAIDRVRYDAEGNDNANLNDEWVRLANAANETVQVGGWQLADEAGHTYTFPANSTLSPGANVTVHTGTGNDTDQHLYWGRSQALWNNAGDTASLRDADGRLVDEHAY